jgi:hypothetical protein
MNTTTVTTELHRKDRQARWAPRLVSAELLKLRKRRGLVLSALLLTVVPMILAYVVLISLHASDPANNGPAGGLEHFQQTIGAFALLSVVAAILIGATLGTSDENAGVFRELVVTGRSRLALFAARVPAGLALLTLIIGTAYAVTATLATLLAGKEHAPNLRLLAGTAGWLALLTALSFALALGVSSLLGTRGTAIAILLGWWLIALPVLSNTRTLGSLREALPVPAMDQLAPPALFAGDPAVPMSPTTATAVLLAWTLTPLAVGAWRTCTQDA